MNYKGQGKLTALSRWRDTLSREARLSADLRRAQQHDLHASRRRPFTCARLASAQRAACVELHGCVLEGLAWMWRSHALCTWRELVTARIATDRATKHAHCQDSTCRIAKRNST